MPDRETMYAEAGLTEAQPQAQPTPSEPPKQDAPPAEKAPEETKQAEALKVEPKPGEKVEPEKSGPERLYAGKYKSVEDFEKGYKELESAFHRKSESAAQATKALMEADNREASNAGQDIAKASMETPEEMPDAVMEPEKFRSWLQDRDARILATIEQRREAEDFQQRWRGEYSDIVELEPLVAQRIAADPRALQAKTAHEREAVIREHSEAVRALAGRLVARGREEATQKKEDVVPQPAGVSEEQSPGTQGAPVQLDETDRYILERRAQLDKLKGITR